MFLLASFACGFIFGLGLLVSGMVQPAKVLAFLDIFGAWDPSLAIVMGVALIVTYTGYSLAHGHGAPVLAERSLWPTATNIDARLILGSVLFGVGWGLVGLCPGPAIEALVSLSPAVIVFVLAMAAGMAGHGLWERRLAAPPQKALTADG
jgi:uncharacterized membrane protein YedE/YeeE